MPRGAWAGPQAIATKKRCGSGMLKPFDIATAHKTANQIKQILNGMAIAPAGDGQRGRK
jgi:hypothetical protein